MTPAELSSAVVAAIRAAVDAGELAVPIPVQVTVERPKVREHGDYATNAALQLARAAGRPPREVADVIAARLRTTTGVATVDVAGPGFLNVRLDQAAVGEIARTVVRAGRLYGHAGQRTGERINLEFVSANPTGPVTLASTRWAAVGDALARLLTAAGADVATEYYVNDAGEQIDKFGRSLLAAARKEPPPEDGYAGEYVKEVAQQVVDDNPGLLEFDTDKALAIFTRDGVALMLAEIKRTMSDFGVGFDLFFSEGTLHDKGELAAARDRLEQQGHVYEKDSATWLRTTDFGDDKDRVLVKSDGEWTYFAADCAYYLDKRTRGFDRCLYLLGADHHGYVGRLKAIAACFGDEPGRNIEVIIGQMVNLFRGGQPVRMSKRAGNFLTLADLVDAVGVDAARYSLVRASIDSTLDLDLDLVTRQTADNPVFYVQYAATRAASILRNARDLGIDPDVDPESVDVALLDDEREVELLTALGEFPRVVATAAELREPHRVARYLEEQVARLAQRVFDECRVLPRGDEEVTPLTHARLLLWRAARVVLENGLGLLGVSAPERM